MVEDGGTSPWVVKGGGIFPPEGGATSPWVVEDGGVLEGATPSVVGRESPSVSEETSFSGEGLLSVVGGDGMSPRLSSFSETVSGSAMRASLWTSGICSGECCNHSTSSGMSSLASLPCSSRNFT